MSDYLWDRSGPPDPDVASLEEALSELRYQGELPVLPAQPAPSSRGWITLLTAAVVLLATAATLYTSRPYRRTPSGPTWSVDAVAGQPRISNFDLGQSGHLGVGEWLVTDADSKARITVADIGLVDVGPSSRIRLVATRPTEHRLELARGRLEATVTAPPRLFLVDTPAAQAIDLGCKYSLDVDDSGVGLLDVSLGFVELASNGRRSIVPAGARCAMRPGVGPGTPYAVDAEPALVAALDRLDFGGGALTDLQQVVRLAEEADALTLWHLLSRVGERERALVYDRLVTVELPPEGVTRQGMLQLDPAMLEAWRLRLGLGW